MTPKRPIEFARALTLVRPVTRRRLYWTARGVFVSDQSQLQAFDAVFASVFGDPEQDRPFDPDHLATAAAHPDERPVAAGDSGPGGTPAPAPGGDADADDAGTEVPLAMASDEYRLMSRLELATPMRQRRRRERAAHGRHIDLRRTLRASLRTGGEPVRLAHRHRRIAPRRLVMLCDISGSMEPYARAYLQFLTCAAGAGPNAEAFAFATRLTRLTRALRSRSPERAIQRAAAAAPDWSSGTRIGDALKAFNDRYGRRGMARGALVVILSDGWERGDPALVAREMERLSRLAYRIVWVNPRVAASGFSPHAGGMAAALPHCDALVSGHSLEALEEVVEAIAAERRQPPSYEPAEEEETWASATPVQGSSIAMPSGYGPSRGKTTPGWGPDGRE